MGEVERGDAVDGVEKGHGKHSVAGWKEPGERTDNPGRRTGSREDTDRTETQANTVGSLEDGTADLRAADFLADAALWAEMNFAS